ncbi:MAG TPA: hypothetical protein VG497_05735 [Kribbella sp.]|nr:hypothetical protein [Kribbella sp.]
MAKFEHKRYPSIELQGDKDAKPYARFTPEAREFGEHTVHVGVLETDDAAVIARLRAAIDAGGDPDLSEVDRPAEEPKEDGDGLDDLDVDALRALAAKEALEVDKRLGHDKLVAAIREHRQN